MRSPSERRRTASVLAALAVGLAFRTAHPAIDPGPAAHPSDREISAALEALKSDPNLAGTRKMHVLHWAGKPKESEKTHWDAPDWIKWIGSLFSWVAEAGRLLIWAAAATLAALLAIYILRFVKERDLRAAPAATRTPSHIQELDIRPESLPDDIGAAARALQERGALRAALALLYRGSLSRLVHVYGLPIRESTTEGECIDLAARSLSPHSCTYMSQLVRVWQRAVYRGEAPQPQVLTSLCDEFAAALDSRPAANADGLAA